MQEEQKNLSLREKIGYGLGDTAFNLYFQTFILFLLYFYTDIFGISATAAGTMFLVTRVWDALNDPIMGTIADRTNTRWGKYRPYLLWFAVPFGVLGVLMFTTPDFEGVGKLIYAYITYILMMMVYTVVNVPYSALMGVMTSSSEDRTIISSFRFVSAFIGMFIVQYVVLFLVKKLGSESETAGWQRAMAVLSVICITLFFLAFASTKERVQPPKEQNSSLVNDLKDLVTNKPWLMIGGATIFQLAFIVIRSGSIMYYFEYYIKDREIMILGQLRNFSFGQLASSFMLSGTALTIFGAILTKWFSQHLGKSKTYSLFLFLSAITAGTIYFLKPNQIILIFGMHLVTSFCIGPVSVLQWALYTDSADYSEWKNGRRATGLVMAASLFSLKCGIAVGGAILAWVLAGFGYQPNVPQTEKALNGICLNMSVLPAIFAMGGAILMVFYPLDNTMMKKIEMDLIERRV